MRPRICRKQEATKIIYHKGEYFQNNLIILPLFSDWAGYQTRFMFLLETLYSKQVYKQWLHYKCWHSSGSVIAKKEEYTEFRREGVNLWTLYCDKIVTEAFFPSGFAEYKTLMSSPTHTHGSQERTWLITTIKSVNECWNVFHLLEYCIVRSSWLYLKYLIKTSGKMTKMSLKWIISSHKLLLTWYIFKKFEKIVKKWNCGANSSSLHNLY